MTTKLAKPARSDQGSPEVTRSVTAYGPGETPFSNEKAGSRTVSGLIRDWLAYRGEWRPGLRDPDLAGFEDRDMADELQVQLHRVLAEKYPGIRFEREGAQIWADRNTLFGEINVEFRAAIDPYYEPELWPAC